MLISDKLILRKIKYWPVSSADDINNIIDCIKAHWTDASQNIEISTLKQGSQSFVRLILNTAGDDKNEQILDALSFSRFWDLFWTDSNVSGQHCFKIDLSKFPNSKTGNIQN